MFLQKGIRSAYICLVRPVLEYACPVLDPHSLGLGPVFLLVLSLIFTIRVISVKPDFDCNVLLYKVFIALNVLVYILYKFHKVFSKIRLMNR